MPLLILLLEDLEVNLNTFDFSMKKLLVSLFLGMVLLSPVQTQAIDLGGGLVKSAAEKAGYDAGTNEQSFAELIGTVIKTVLSFVGVIFLVLMVYAGFLWMTARGDEAKIEKSQDIIRSSIIGLVIMVGAYSITSFVVPRIVEKTTGDSTGGGGGGGGGNVLCCVICPRNGGGNCVESVVGNEGQCLQQLGCPDNAVNNVDNDCSITPSPANQCGGQIDRVNCCFIQRPGAPEERRRVQDANACDNICDAENGDDFGVDVDQDGSCDMQVVEANQC